MTKIHTVTLNPAVDIRNGNKYAGGKGINVSRALHNLGVRNVLTYTFAGRARGKELCSLMEEAGLDYVVQETEAETRITEILQGDPEIKKSSESPMITDEELTGLVQKLERRLDNGDYVVLAGSLPRGVHPEIYGALIVGCTIIGAKAILDASQEAALKQGIIRSPYMIKPNAEECEMLAGRQNHTSKLLREILSTYQIPYGIATKGKEGLMLASNGPMITAVPPEVKVGSTVGCGDAVTAGFLYSQLNEFSDEETARFAAACGTASAKKEGTELCTLDDALRIAKDVKVSKI